MGIFINEVGKRYGKLVVLHRVPNHGGRAYWQCRCDCGKEFEARGASLRNRSATACASCGTTVHGYTNTPTWNSWMAMLRRCYTPDDRQFKNYIGVKVCARWHKFKNFLADMGERPKDKTLDRFPDPGGNYEPGNCRWATLSEQNTNRRKSCPI